MPIQDPKQPSIPSAKDLLPNAQVLALSDLEQPSAAQFSQPIGRESSAALTNPLHQIKTQLTVCVGEAELTVGELLGAKEHQVFRLDRTIDQPVDILLEGQVVARGTLVAVDDHFGVRITELPLPLKP